ncbi:hypothetical protein DH2020_049464 [Rehmannia glutinosa]|uniref:Uncharacterized protein n=1 Tax=Rehmannia glutinosa TaxID=99300 RepID=A0ABR0U3C2_REHGL
MKNSKDNGSGVSIYDGANNSKNNATPVKTPPVEASLSPEIQFQSHSKKIPVLKSETTPVCYKRRGSLKCSNDGNSTDDLRDFSIPLLSEASVRWVLSPYDEDQCRMVVCDDDLRTLDLLCGDVSYKKNSDTNELLTIDLIGDNVTLSTCSLTSGNIIRTPNSDVCGEYGEFIDSITESLNIVNLSPKFEMSMWDNEGSVSSLVSNTTTLDNLAMSRMRISWRDGLGSGIFENDEFDGWCLLSDEEGDSNDNGLRTDDDDLSPMVLDYEPCISARGKDKSSSNIRGKSTT